MVLYRSTNERTDGPTDRRTDKASYRDAWTHLKICNMPAKNLQYSCKKSATNNLQSNLENLCNFIFVPSFRRIFVQTNMFQTSLFIFLVQTIRAWSMNLGFHTNIKFKNLGISNFMSYRFVFIFCVVGWFFYLVIVNRNYTGIPIRPLPCFSGSF